MRDLKIPLVNSTLLLFGFCTHREKHEDHPECAQSAFLTIVLMWALSAAQSSSNMSLVFLPSQMRFSCVSLTLQPPTPLGKKKPSERTPPVLHQSPSVPICATPLLLLWRSFPCFSKDTLVCSISQCSHFLKEFPTPLSLSCIISISLFTVFFTDLQTCFSPHLKKENPSLSATAYMTGPFYWKHSSR